MVVSGIYRITNTLNKKVYVGQSINIQKREGEHFRDLQGSRHANRYLQRSYNYHGKENFKFEIIENCSVDALNNREEFWIKEHKSHERKFGFNLTLGGGGKGKLADSLKRIISLKLRGENSPKASINNKKVRIIKLLLLDGLSYKEISEITGTSIIIIRSIKCGKNWSHIYSHLNVKIMKMKLNGNIGRVTKEETRRKISESRLTYRGEKHPLASVSNEEVFKIKTMLIGGKSPKEIEKEIGASKYIIQSIKNCNSWTHVMANYNDKLRENTKKRLTESEIKEIKLALLNATECSVYKVICDKYNISKMSVINIKKCSQWKNVAPELSVQLKEKKYKDSFIKIKDEYILEIKRLLQEGVSPLVISKMFNVSRTSIYNVKQKYIHMEQVI